MFANVRVLHEVPAADRRNFEPFLCFMDRDAGAGKPLHGVEWRRPGRIQHRGQRRQFGELLNKQTGSLQFFGKVAMAAGKLPWDPIPVVVTCGGTARYNTVADAKGGFYIVAAGRSSELSPEKKDPNHAAPSALVGCSVSALVEGFTSTRLTIANRTLEDDPSLGTIT